MKKILLNLFFVSNLFSVNQIPEVNSESIHNNQLNNEVNDASIVSTEWIQSLACNILSSNHTQNAFVNSAFNNLDFLIENDMDVYTFLKEMILNKTIFSITGLMDPIDHIWDCEIYIHILNYAKDNYHHFTLMQSNELATWTHFFLSLQQNNNRIDPYKATSGNLLYLLNLLSQYPDEEGIHNSSFLITSQNELYNEDSEVELITFFENSNTHRSNPLTQEFSSYDGDESFHEGEIYQYATNTPYFLN